MDLTELGSEYLQDAARIREYLVELREQLNSPEEGSDYLLKWRVSTLYRMYLECRTMGEYLRRHPGGSRE